MENIRASNLESHQTAKVAKVISTLKVLHKLCLKLVLINSQKKIFKSHRCEVKKCIYSSTLKKLACMCRQTVSSGHQCATIEPETNYKHYQSLTHILFNMIDQFAKESPASFVVCFQILPAPP
jgi:hypothetical protein